MSSELPEGENKEEEAEGGAGEGKVGCIASLIPVTTPGCASLLTFVFLFTTVAAVWLYFWLDPSNVPWRHSYSWLRIAGICALVFVLPWVVYKTIYLWMEGSPKAFPEVEAAWRAGLHALEANELSIHSVPIFLVLGSSSEAQEKSLMNATGLRFSVEGVPQGPAPIHWYANSEAIYLFCSDTSWTSALASLREEVAAEAKAAGLNIESNSIPFLDLDIEALRRNQAAESQWETRQSNLGASTGYDRPSADYTGSSGFANPVTNAGPSSLPSSSSSGSASGNTPNVPLRGTLELREFIDPSSSNPPKPSAPTSNAPPNFKGTLMLGDTGAGSTEPMSSSNVPHRGIGQERSGGNEERSRYGHSQSGGSATPDYSVATFRTESQSLLSNQKPILVSHQYSSACLQELNFLGELLRKARQPLCPINGVLALLQFESIHSTVAETEELKKALRGDITTIQNAVAVRSPVTSLIVGLEKERGFRELVRRVGRDRALSQRFGRRFDVQSTPRKEEIAAFSTLACGVFEDWAYTLFREQEALTKPGNTRLYELLSKVRCGWKGKLADILSGSFGCDHTSRSESQSPYYSGCYFAATGETPDRQAFVKGVIEKLVEEQEMVEWTSDTLSAFKRQQFIATAGMIVTLILIILFAAQFIYFNVFQSSGA